MNTTLISTFGIYLGKVTLLSGILYAYYHFSLKDKQNFGWTRFYRLACAVLSVFIPFLSIPLRLLEGPQNGPGLAHLLTVVPGAGEFGEEREGAVHSTAHTFPWAMACLLAYGAVITVLLAIFAWHLWRLAKLKRQSPQQQMDSITLIDTQTPGAPFSFFRWIFWDAQLPVDSTEGRHILRHELAHVRGWHSLDKIGMQLLCIGLFPVIPFYLIRRELQLIHEYQADRQAADSSEVAAYATFLVQHALHTPTYSLSNGFYQHPLNKRIAMMMQFLPTRRSNLRKWVALPLFVLLFGLFAFTLKQKTAFTLDLHIKPSKVMTVVIDPGHGGMDAGVIYKGLTEKDLNLSISKEIARLAPEYKVNVILSRNKDMYDPVGVKADFINRQHADLMVSIHVNANMKAGDDQAKNPPVLGDSTSSGMETYISPKNAHYNSCLVLGSIMQQHLAQIYPSVEEVMQRNEGIRVLGEANCPAVLVECGYLTNSKDAAFLSDASNREKIARKILESIVAYSEGASLTYPVNHHPGN